MAMGAYHGVKVHDDIDFWETYRKYAETVQSPPLCYNRGDHCVCSNSEEYLKSGYTGRITHLRGPKGVLELSICSVVDIFPCSHNEDGSKE